MIMMLDDEKVDMLLLWPEKQSWVVMNGVRASAITHVGLGPISQYGLIIEAL